MMPDKPHSQIMWAVKKTTAAGKIEFIDMMHKNRASVRHFVQVWRRYHKNECPQPRAVECQVTVTEKTRSKK
jgi:hypothetical protein